MAAKAEDVLITSDGIKNSLKKYKPLQALVEFVWNGFDAHATCVDIQFEGNELNGSSFIRVRDNGDGIDKELLSQKFKPFFESEKIYTPNVTHSAVHGKNGVGRLTFFKFANLAKWETTYEREGTQYSYEIDISEATLQKYIPSNEVISNSSTGTTVTFSDLLDTDISCDTARDYLSKVFCWFLELNKDQGYSITVNGESLDYESLVLERETQNYLHEKSKTAFCVRYVCWNIKLSDYSKYYYIDSKGKEIGKENTTLNNKGDRFYHSVYIQSSFFDSFDMEKVQHEQMSMKTFHNEQSPEFVDVMHEINRRLFDIRRPFIKATADRIVESLEIENAFPHYDSKNELHRYKKQQIADMVSAIYIAQPRIFSSSMNKDQRKTFIRLLDLIMESGEIDSLFSVFDEILDMTESERHELAEILKYSRLSNITKTITMIRDRYQAVEDIKNLVFNKELHANEIDHLQKIIEKHYWIFGEQYNLVTAAEPTFEEGLRRYLRYLNEDYNDVFVDSPDRLKQMDIFAVRQDLTGKTLHNIVVELKHPKINLGEKQLSQVKKYMNTILNIPQYNADNMTWEFYLIGNQFSDDNYIAGELESNSVHGEPFLVFKRNNYSIYVLRWSEVFTNFELRHSFLNERLALERDKLRKSYDSASEIIEAQNTNTAIAPKEMPSTKSSVST